MAPIVRRLGMQGYTPESFRALDARERTAALSIVARFAEQDVRDAAAKLVESNQSMRYAPRVSIESLADSAKALSAFERQYEAYLDDQSLGEIISAARQSRKIVAEAHKNEAEARAYREAEKLRPQLLDDPLFQMAPNVDGADKAVIAAGRQLAELRDNTTSRGYAQTRMDALVRIGVSAHRDAQLQRTIVDGLSDEFARPLESRNFLGDELGSNHLDAAERLARIAEASRSPVVQGAAVKAIMDAVARDSSYSFSGPAVRLVEHIAVGSPNPRVKALAIAYLNRELGKATEDTPQWSIRNAINEIARSAGGLSELKIPVVPAKPDLISAPHATVRGTIDGLIHVVRVHPIGAAIGLSLASVAVLYGIVTLPSLAATALSIILVDALITGLKTHHPVSTAAQLGAFALGMRAIAAANLSVTAAVGAAAVLALTWAALANWTAKNDHPVSGSILNGIAMWVLAALSVGVARMPLDRFQVITLAVGGTVMAGLCSYLLHWFGKRPAKP